MAAVAPFEVLCQAGLPVASQGRVDVPLEVLDDVSAGLIGLFAQMLTDQVLAQRQTTCGHHGRNLTRRDAQDGGDLAWRLALDVVVPQRSLLAGGQRLERRRGAR